VEESPSVILTPELRKEMGEAAIALVRHAKYEGAGTVEFLVGQDRRYYLLEVNTRLQVEHPVTECVTGLDLVREQFRIAEGEPLRLTQKDIHHHGHSIEVRIQSEDVWNEFFPSLGRVSFVRHPAGAFVRNDSAMFAGLEVSGFYDSLLSKLIVWDESRSGAIRRMSRALDEMKIVGVQTTIPFAAFVMRAKPFIDGNLSTAFVEESFTSEARAEEWNRYRTEQEQAFLAVRSYQARSEAARQLVGI
jgi:acetyl-CoA carboxylase biotin carboxylase subunit